MSRFQIGNVVKLQSSLIIITGHRTIIGREVTDWVDFSHQNSSGSTQAEDEEYKTPCYKCSGEEDDCEDCKGTGEVTNVRIGMNRGVCVGLNVKDYILKALTKNFEF